MPTESVTPITPTPRTFAERMSSVERRWNSTTNSWERVGPVEYGFRDGGRSPATQSIGEDTVIPVVTVEPPDGFTAGMSPMQRARANAALDKLIRFNGKPETRRSWIEREVKLGATVVERPRWGRVLQDPRGSFMEQAQLTKTGMDYADYLIEVRTILELGE